MAQHRWRPLSLEDEPLHCDWRTAAPAVGLRSLAAVAMTVPALLAVGVYWLHRTPAGSGQVADNVMQVQIVASQAIDAPRQEFAASARALSAPGLSPQNTELAVAAAKASESVASQSSTSSGTDVKYALAAPAWDTPVPGSPLALTQTKLDQKAMTFVRTVKSHIARFQHYPESAKRERIHGNVVLVLTLQRDGTVTHVGVVSSSGFASLDSAAVDTVRRAQPLPSIPLELPGQLNLDYTIAFDLPQ